MYCKTVGNCMKILNTPAMLYTWPITMIRLFTAFSIEPPNRLHPPPPPSALRFLCDIDLNACVFAIGRRG